MLACFGLDDSKVLILDMRSPGQPVAELIGHQGALGALAWGAGGNVEGSSGGWIASCGQLSSRSVIGPSADCVSLFQVMTASCCFTTSPTPFRNRPLDLLLAPNQKLHHQTPTPSRLPPRRHPTPRARPAHHKPLRSCPRKRGLPSQK